MSLNFKGMIYLVDDERTSLQVNIDAIEDDFDYRTFDDGDELLDAFNRGAAIPDLILLDIDMPGKDGYETLIELKRGERTKSIPVIFMTGNDDVGSESRGLSLGAVDYVTKTTPGAILHKRIETQLELDKYRKSLEEQVEAKTQKIVGLQSAILRTMAEVVEFRDEITGGHIVRTQKYLEVLIDELKKRGKYQEEVSKWDIEHVLQSAQLHDVGKIAVKDHILSKPGKLTKEEFDNMQKHTTFGKSVIEKIEESTSEQAFLEYAKLFAVTHHEKWDGNGYPERLKGDEIPLLGRLMAIADVYDALVSKRPYKEPLSHEEAARIISEGKGSQFDPNLVEIFEYVKDQFQKIAEAYNNDPKYFMRTDNASELGNNSNESALKDEIKNLREENARLRSDNGFLRLDIDQLREKSNGAFTRLIETAYRYGLDRVGDTGHETVGLDIYSAILSWWIKNHEGRFPKEFDIVNCVDIVLMREVTEEERNDPNNYHEENVMTLVEEEGDFDGSDFIEEECKFVCRDTLGTEEYTLEKRRVFAPSDVEEILEEDRNRFVPYKDSIHFEPFWTIDGWADPYWCFRIETKKYNHHKYYVYVNQNHGEFIDLFNFLMDDAIKSLLYKIEDNKAISNARNEHFARISHELKNALNQIMSPIGLDDISPENRIRETQRIAEGLRPKIINMIDISKIELHEVTPNPAISNLSSLLERVINRHKIHSDKPQICFTVNIDCQTPKEIFWDEHKVEVMLDNLLSNAFKYTKAGNVSLTVSWEKQDEQTGICIITVKDSGRGIDKATQKKIFNAYERGDPQKNEGIEGHGLGLNITKKYVEAMGGDIKVESTVEDLSDDGTVRKNGETVFTVRLPQNIVDYEPFAAVNNPKEKSTLVYYNDKSDERIKSLIRGIDNLGVRYAFASNEHEFCEKIKKEAFSFVFAAHELVENAKKICDGLNASSKIVRVIEPGKSAGSADDSGIISVNAPLYSLKIANILNNKINDVGRSDAPSFIAPEARALVVDDEETNVAAMRSWLSPYRMQVDGCNSGKDAIKKVKDIHYDLIFMDHQMPEMDGIEAAKSICGIDNKLPIVALTGNNDSTTKKSFAQVGVKYILSKPIDSFKRLNQILEKLIHQNKQKKTRDISRADNNESNPDVVEKDKFLNLLSIFHGDWSESSEKKKITKFKNSFEQNNMKDYKRFVHSLKTSLKQIGATPVSEKAEKLEAAAKREDIDFIRERHTDFFSELESLLGNIGRRG